MELIFIRPNRPQVEGASAGEAAQLSACAAVHPGSLQRSSAALSKAGEPGARPWQHEWLAVKHDG